MLVDAGGAEVDVCAAPSATVCAGFGGGVEIVAGANVVEMRVNRPVPLYCRRVSQVVCPTFRPC